MIIGKIILKLVKRDLTAQNWSRGLDIFRFGAQIFDRHRSSNNKVPTNDELDS